MVKVLFDINIFQDVLTARNNADNSLSVIFLARDHQIHGHISPISIPTLWYLNRKELNRRRAIQDITKSFTLVDLNGKMATMALYSPYFPDLEDELQSLAAETSECDYIITRNLKDFKNSRIPAVTPEQFLDSLS